MPCFVHADRNSTGACAVCGRPHCEECLIQVGDTLVCKSCAAKLILRSNDDKPEAPPKCYSIFVGLALLLGPTGAHFFYSGATGSGAVMFILSAVFFAISAATGGHGYFFLVIMEFIAFFQAATIKKDGYGRPFI